MENEANINKGLGAKIKKHKILSIIIFLLIAATLFRLGQFAWEKMNPEETETVPTSVKVAAAEFGSILSTSPLSGRITPTDEVAVCALATGQITAVNVQVGDRVRTGQVMVQIDSGALLASYTQAETNYHRMEALFAEGAISQADLDAAYTAYAQLQAQMSNYTVTSPIDGYVTSLNASVGSLAAASVLATVANTDSLEIRTTVSEYLASYIHIGDAVSITVPSLGEQTYSGTVTEFSPAPAMNTLTYPVTISIDDQSDELMSGMFAQVNIISAEAADVICLPSDAVLIKGGKQIVVLLDQDNIPTFSEVVVGIDNGDFVEIVSGVSKGDIVVVSGQSFVTEGQAVRIAE